MCTRAQKRYGKLVGNDYFESFYIIYKVCVCVCI